MNQVLVISGQRQVAIEEYEDIPLGPKDIRIRTMYSGISAGTEMTQYRGSSPFLHKRWDLEKRLFIPDSETSLKYPIRTLGYEEAGEVVEIGDEVAGVAVGDFVFGTWGHRTYHIGSEADILPRKMPVGLDPECGVFSHIGAIALNGVHDGRIRIGETVAVFGLGVLGQIVAQAARHSGARVIAVDLHEARLKMAKNFGVWTTINAAKDQAAEAIKDLTGGKGADVCFEVSGSTLALQEAVRAAAYSARVVAMGFFQGEARGLYMGEEFHHNRINMVCSQIGGTDPELQYRWSKLRLWQTAIALQHQGVLNLRPLITHRASFDRAAELFELLDQHSEEVIQAVLEFPKE